MSRVARIISITFFWIFGAVPTLMAADADSAQLICQEQVEMGTPFKICVYSLNSQKLSVDFDLKRSFKKISEINSWMSEWQPGTQLSEVNAAAGARAVKVSRDLFEVIDLALKVSRKSEGAFDPTFNAFWGLYNFKAGAEREPTEEEIKERLPLINYRHVVLDPKSLSVFLKNPGMKLGLGALGQGYAVDLVSAELKKNYAAGYVDGSGDTVFWGKKPNGELWTAAIRDPRDKTKNVMRIYGTDFALTTAGDDEKFFMRGNRRVHHIIDPKTGRPATASRQVSVISKKAVLADAWDTAAFVMGPSRARPLLKKMGFESVIVTEKNVFISEGLKAKKTDWGEVFTLQKDF